MAHEICQVLLDHHDRLLSYARRPVFDKCLISYGELCDAAGAPELTRNVGVYLGEIAQWCADHGWPPLNCLAVNAESRQPGTGYENASGCSLNGWVKEVEACLSCRDYPRMVVT